MTSQVHQLMSQGNQVVETTPGHSQKLFKLSNGIAVQANTKNNNQTYIHRGQGASTLAVWEVLYGEQNLNSSQQVWCAGI